MDSPEIISVYTVALGIIGILLVAYLVTWLRYRLIATGSPASDVDQYLFRRDLAGGAAPQNVIESLIAIIIRRTRAVFVFLLGLTVVGFLVMVILDSWSGMVLFGYLFVIVAIAATLFLGAPYVERYLTRER